jgi:hypothetical protein
MLGEEGCRMCEGRTNGGAIEGNLKCGFCGEEHIWPECYNLCAFCNRVWGEELVSIGGKDEARVRS